MNEGEERRRKKEKDEKGEEGGSGCVFDKLLILLSTSHSKFWGKL